MAALATRRYVCCVPLDAEKKEGEVSLGSVHGGVVKLLKARGCPRAASARARRAA